MRKFKVTVNVDLSFVVDAHTEEEAVMIMENQELPSGYVANTYKIKGVEEESK